MLGGIPGASDIPCQELGTKTRNALVPHRSPTCPSNLLRKPSLPSGVSAPPTPLSTCSHHARLSSRSDRILPVPISWSSGNVTVGLAEWFLEDRGPAWTCSPGPLVPSTMPGTRRPPRMPKSCDDKPDIPNGPLPLTVDLGAQAPSPPTGLTLPVSPHSSAASWISPRQAPSLGASPGMGDSDTEEPSARGAVPAGDGDQTQHAVTRTSRKEISNHPTVLFITHSKMVCCYKNIFAHYTNRPSQQLP